MASIEGRSGASVMAEAYAVDSTRVQAMDDQLWRCVGVTQAFEILLCRGSASQPCPAS